MTTQLPAHLQNLQVRPLAQSIAGNLGTGSPPYVSIMGNKFTLIDAVGETEPVATFDPKLGPYLDCVIIDSGDHESKEYYSKPFDPTAQSWSPPECWSDNGIGPSRNASNPQYPTCGGCPKAVWGSATSKVSGKGVPACAKKQKLALIPAGDEMAFLLRVPPNSLSNLRDYIHKFNGQNFDLPHVVTRITFEQGTLGTLQFVAVGFIDAETAALYGKLMAAKATDPLVGRGDMPREGLPSPQQAPQITVQPAVQPEAIPATQQPAPQAQPMPGGATTASPSEPPRQRRRRNTAAEPAQQAPAAEPVQAPFRQAAEAQPAGAPFGIAQGTAPDPALSAAIDSVFGPAR